MQGQFNHHASDVRDITFHLTRFRAPASVKELGLYLIIHKIFTSNLRCPLLVPALRRIDVAHPLQVIAVH